MVRQGNRKKSIWWAFGAVGAFLLTKAKALSPLFNMGKAGGAVLSMGVAIGFYAWLYQWEFALGVVVMVLMHELGHVMAARQKGIPVTLPFFIPFLGALIMLKRNPRDAVTEAYIALGGPLLGSAASLVCFGIAAFSGHHLFYAIAYIGFILNLINLLPIHPLDGGRIASTVTRWLWVAGLLLGIFVILYIKSYMLFIIWALFALDLGLRFLRKGGKHGHFSIWGQVEVPFGAIPGGDWMVTGYDSRGELPFRTYSDLDGKQWVELHWEFAGVAKTVEMPEQGLIRSVRCLRVEPRWQREPKVLAMRYQIDYEPYENENYYNVPRPIRWRFGLIYGGLVLFLLLMLVAIQTELAPQDGLLDRIVGKYFPA